MPNGADIKRIESAASNRVVVVDLNCAVVGLLNVVSFLNLLLLQLWYRSLISGWLNFLPSVGVCVQFC